MSKYVYINGNTVGSIIPEHDPTFPGIPIQKRYAKSFLDKCVVVDDAVDVSCGMVYDPATKEFSHPVVEVEPIEEPIENPEAL